MAKKISGFHNVNSIVSVELFDKTEKLVDYNYLVLINFLDQSSISKFYVELEDAETFMNGLKSKLTIIE